MKIYGLINKKLEECELIFVPIRENDFKNSLNGILLELTSWSGKSATDIGNSDFNFIANIYLKWDGCSHFNFYGQDYVGDKESKQNCDSYYHICGFNSYIKHFRSMVFAYQLAINKLGECFDSEYEIPEYNKFKKSIDLLEGYEIKEIILEDEQSVLWYSLKDYEEN